MDHRIWAALGAAFVFVSFAASAETYEKAVKANTRTVIGGFAGYEVETCYASEIPDVKIRQAPRNGELVIQPYTMTLSKATRCPGKSVNGLAYIYTSRKGFKGQDEVVIDVPWFTTDTGRAPTIYTHTYRITVE